MTVPRVGGWQKGKPRNPAKLRRMIVWIRRYVRENGHMPSMAQVARNFGYKNRGGIWHTVNALIEAGLLCRLPKARRTKFVLGPDQGDPHVYGVGGNVIVDVMPPTLTKQQAADLIKQLHKALWQ